MKKTYYLIFAVLCILVSTFLSCTNYKNAELYSVGEYIEKQFGYHSAEYAEYSSLSRQLDDNQQWTREQGTKYGDESKEFYTALKETIESQKSMLAYFDKIGAQKASEDIKAYMTAYESRASQLGRKLAAQEQANKQFLNSVVGTYRSEPTNNMGTYVLFRIKLTREERFVMEILDAYANVLSSKSGKFSPVAEKKGCVLNPNTSDWSWIDVINSGHIRLGEIDLYK